jgi:hypothetical protein
LPPLAVSLTVSKEQAVKPRLLALRRILSEPAAREPKLRLAAAVELRAAVEEVAAAAPRLVVAVPPVD